MNGMDGGDVKPDAEPSIPCDVLAQRMRLPAWWYGFVGGRKLHHRAVVDSGWRLYVGNPQFNPE